MTVEQLTAEIEKVEAQIRAEEAKSNDYTRPERIALVRESDRLYDERQAIYKAQAKAIREQIKALKAELETIEEKIW